MNKNGSTFKLPPGYSLLEQDVNWFVVDIENQQYIELDEAISILSAEEEKRRGRFKTNELQSSFAIRRGLLRALIAKQTQSEIDEIIFESNKYGKLFINQNKVHFNSSHSRQYIVYVFSSTKELGVDIEKVDSMNDEANTANYIMTEVEHSLYTSLPEDKATLFFFKCWTAKEAYLKLLGVGLNIEPKEVLLELDEITPVSARVVDYRTATLTPLNVESENSYVACLATYDE